MIHLPILFTSDKVKLLRLMQIPYHIKVAIMMTVAVRNKYVEALSTFGNLEEVVDLALQRYTIEQVTTKRAELIRQDADFQAKYGMDYESFSQRIATDEAFVDEIEANVNRLWEMDLAEWEFCNKGIEDWTRKLQAILIA